MRRFLLGMCLVALFAGVVSASVAAKERPGGIIATPSKIEFGTIPNDGYQLKWVSITNGTTHVISFRTPELASPFSFVEARDCDELAPGPSECMIGYRVDGATAGTFKASLQQRFLWFDARGVEHPMYVALKLTAIVSANHAPTTSSQTVSTSENTSVTITLTGSDPDGDLLDFAVWMKNVSGGELSNIDSTGHFTNVDCAMGPPSECTPQTTYTPNEDFTGTDSFGFKVDDGQFFMARGINITVTGGEPASGVSASPETLDFGEHALNTQSALSVTFTNNTSSTAYLDSSSVSGPFTASGSSWPACAEGVGPSQSCTAWVVFEPTEVGTLTGTLTTDWIDMGSDVVGTTTTPLKGIGTGS